MINSRYFTPVVLSSLSTTYVKCKISATENGVAANPTTGTIEFAFIADTSNNTDPASGDWKAGNWETASDGYYGKCLVGPEGVGALTVGNYDVWVRVTKSPEKVIDRVGTLAIY